MLKKHVSAINIAQTDFITFPVMNVVYTNLPILNVSHTLISGRAILFLPCACPYLQVLLLNNCPNICQDNSFYKMLCNCKKNKSFLQLRLLELEGTPITDKVINQCLYRDLPSLEKVLVQGVRLCYSDIRAII